MRWSELTAALWCLSMSLAPEWDTVSTMNIYSAPLDRAPTPLVEDVTPFGPSTNRPDIDLEDSRQDPSGGKSKDRFGDGPGGAGDRQVYLEGIEHELAESTEG